MTNLPATYVEAEALAFARKQIVHFFNDGTPWSSLSPFSADGSRAFVRNLLRRYALRSAIDRMQVIAWARAGDPDAIGVLKEMIIEMKSRRAELPVELENYNMEVLRGGMGHLPPGPKKKNKYMRNICIAVTIAVVVDRFGLDPTGRSPSRRSACSIVAEALAEIGMRLGDKAVETIWKTLGSTIHRRNPWTVLPS